MLGDTRGRRERSGGLRAFLAAADTQHRRDQHDRRNNYSHCAFPLYFENIKIDNWIAATAGVVNARSRDLGGELALPELDSCDHVAGQFFRVLAAEFGVREHAGMP